MAIETHRAHNDDADLWNIMVKSSPHATPFHAWNWLKIAQKNTGMNFYPLIVYNGNESIAITAEAAKEHSP